MVFTGARAGWLVPVGSQVRRSGGRLVRVGGLDPGAVEDDRLDRGVAPADAQRRQGKLRKRLPVPGARVLQGSREHQLPVLDDVHQKVAVVAVTDRGRTQPDDLGLRATALAQPAHRELAASQGVLAF